MLNARFLLEGGECKGDCTGINIGEVFSQDFWGILPHFWVDWTLAILFIFIFCARKGCTQKLLFFCLYSNETRWGYLDLIDFQLQILTHQQI